GVVRLGFDEGCPKIVIDTSDKTQLFKAIEGGVFDGIGVFEAPIDVEFGSDGADSARARIEAQLIGILIPPINDGADDVLARIEEPLRVDDTEQLVVRTRTLISTEQSKELHRERELRLIACKHERPVDVDH